MELAPGTVFAGYRIEEIIGRGGMGVVYRATHMTLDAPRALKVIAPEFAADQEFRARFEREARLAASLDHTAVIPIHDAREEEGVLFIAMRYVIGSDLDRVLTERGRLPAAEAAGVVAQVAGALDAAHEKGLVHRDVKPANVLIERRPGEDRIYLTDFG